MMFTSLHACICPTGADPPGCPGAPRDDQHRGGFHWWICSPRDAIPDLGRCASGMWDLCVRVLGWVASFVHAPATLPTCSKHLRLGCRCEGVLHL
eukprot:1152316-Pelagomonas_calceolata.AAC.3